MQEDRWLVPEGPASRQQYAVVPLFVEIDRYLGRYANEHLHIMCEFCLKADYFKVCMNQNRIVSFFQSLRRFLDVRAIWISQYSVYK